MADFRAVNMTGTTNVLDAGNARGMRRVVALSTATFINLNTSAPFEQAPVLDDPPDDPYTVTKLAAFREAHERAAAGEDVVTCHPGAIYGPGSVAERALYRTSFNRVLLAGMRGRLKRYLAFPVTWVAAKDVAAGSIAALDRGIAGERYLLVGRPEDTMSTAAGCNRACELAGIDHRVEDLDYRSDPEALTAEFGPTLMAIAEAAAHATRAPRAADNPTSRRLGYDPMSFDEGLGLLIPWLRELGRL
jgi:nucleoside-diphosphate-sugar epimerase